MKLVTLMKVTRLLTYKMGFVVPDISHISLVI